MIWHILASLAVGLGAAAEPSVYLTLKKWRLFFLIWAVVSALFFGYGFIAGLPAQIAYALMALAIGCVLECACYLEVIEDRIYTAMLQYIVSCTAIYLAERFTQSHLQVADQLPGLANEHFVASPITFAIIVTVNILWFLGMLAAYHTIMKYTPYQRIVYRRCIAVTSPLIALILIMAFGGDKIVVSAMGSDFATAFLISSVTVVTLLLGLSTCVSANSRFIIGTRLNLIAEQSRGMLDYVKGIEAYNAQLRRFRHDQRHFIDTLSALLDNSDLDQARTLLNDLSIHNSALAMRGFCENSVINAMLTDAQSKCDGAGITFSTELHMPEAIQISNSDLIALIKNMLDNAIECCTNLDKAEKPTISIKIIAQSGLLVVVCENTIDKVPDIRNNRIKTSKVQSSKTHGIGIESMHHVAAKYGGELTIEAKDKTFTASAYLDNVIA